MELRVPLALQDGDVLLQFYSFPLRLLRAFVASQFEHCCVFFDQDAHGGPIHVVFRLEFPPPCLDDFAIDIKQSFFWD